MYIGHVSLRDFRSYERADFAFSQGMNVLIGENAVGKTNLLEAIYFLSTLKSFRTNKQKDMIRFDSHFSVIEGQIWGYERKFNLKAIVSREKRTEFLLNDIKYKKEKLLQTVLFSPDDLYLVKEGPGARRRFMDQALCQLRPKYGKLLSDYQKFLEEKQRILKKGEEKPSLYLLLDDYSQRLATLSAQIIWYRSGFLKKIEEFAKQHQDHISGGEERLKIAYQTVSTVLNTEEKPSVLLPFLLDHYFSHKQAEIKSKNCLSGVHRDDFLLFINEKEAKNFASQGQTRSLALSLKLAERDLFFSDTGEYPLLLLDDVLSELDKKRQEFILNQIAGSQVIITCCEEEKIGQSLDANIIFIK